jgi:hypothetical protein
MKTMLTIFSLLALAVPAAAQISQQPSGSSANRNDQVVIPARSLTVCVEIEAPDGWSGAIRDALEAKLKAVPEVQVVGDAKKAMFTIDVDVNAITVEGNHLLGYSLAAIISGHFDRNFLRALFEEASKSADPSEAAAAELIQYAISGNVFPVGLVHTHGSTNDIGSAYDEIVSRFQSKGLPEVRKFLDLLISVFRDQPKIAVSTRL